MRSTPFTTLCACCLASATALGAPEVSSDVLFNVSDVMGNLSAAGVTSDDIYGLMDYMRCFDSHNTTTFDDDDDDEYDCTSKFALHRAAALEMIFNTALLPHTPADSPAWERIVDLIASGDLPWQQPEQEFADVPVYEEMAPGVGPEELEASDAAGCPTSGKPNCGKACLPIVWLPPAYAICVANCLSTCARGCCTRSCHTKTGCPPRGCPGFCGEVAV